MKSVMIFCITAIIFGFFSYAYLSGMVMKEVEKNYEKMLLSWGILTLGSALLAILELWPKKKSKQDVSEQ